MPELSRSGHLMIGEILIFITVNQVEKGLETGERETPHLWARSCTGTFNLNFINTKKFLKQRQAFTPSSDERTDERKRCFEQKPDKPA